MITGNKVINLFELNKKDILKAVRKLPTDSHLEVAFYESGKVWISDPLKGGAYMAWKPDFSVQFTANKFVSYSELLETVQERIQYVELGEEN